MVLYAFLLGFALGLAFLTAGYFLFRDTMNRVQYFPFETKWRLYWITRDTGTEKWGRSFMRQTSFPWLRGRGITVKAGQYSFQFGIATPLEATGEEALSQQLGSHDLDLTVEEIRELERNTMVGK